MKSYAFLFWAYNIIWLGIASYLLLLCCLFVSSAAATYLLPPCSFYSTTYIPTYILLTARSNKAAVGR